MTRLIDADVLTDELIKGMEADTDKSVQATFAKSVCMILCKAIEKQPTINAVPVIRCKDCKYWLPHSQFGFDEDNDEFYDYCELLVPDDDYYAITRQAEDFCSRAERKEE